MSRKNEDKGDTFFFEFTGGKTEAINKSWSSDRWFDQLSSLNTIPLKDDVINFRGMLEEKILFDMKQDFGGYVFIVLRRELLLHYGSSSHYWDVYIKPYFPDQEL